MEDYGITNLERSNGFLMLMRSSALVRGQPGMSQSSSPSSRYKWKGFLLPTCLLTLLMTFYSETSCPDKHLPAASFQRCALLAVRCLVLWVDLLASLFWNAAMLNYEQLDICECRDAHTNQQRPNSLAAQQTSRAVLFNADLCEESLMCRCH